MFTNHNPARHDIMAGTASPSTYKRTLLAFVTLTLAWGRRHVQPAANRYGSTLRTGRLLLRRPRLRQRHPAATNSRTGEGFPYLSSPDNIVKGILDNPRCVPGGSNYPACRSVCIPEITEAQGLGAATSVMRAISDMSIPEPWEVSARVGFRPTSRSQWSLDSRRR
jgi:hypothetical protein